VRDPAAIRREVEGQVRELCDDLVKGRGAARTVTLKLRRPDFVTTTRSRTLDQPACDPSTLGRLASSLLQETLAPGSAVRLVGVALTRLAWDDAQLDLPFS
jgi:DNA polymerase-4